MRHLHQNHQRGALVLALCEIQWRLTPFSVRSTNPGIAPAIFEPVLFLDLLSAAQIEEIQLISIGCIYLIYTEFAS
jgi:hypothetical protein